MDAVSLGRWVRMRGWLGLIVLVLLVAGAAVVIWCWLNWEELRLQWSCRRVVQAESYEDAREAIAWFESEPDRSDKLRVLVELWGTGHQHFDLHLARYVAETAAAELRERFSLELGWRPELRPRWAHFWIWRAKLDPAEEIAAVAEHFDLLAAAEPPEPITWRDVLTLQAVFTLTDCADLAHRLKPSSWHGRYEKWQRIRPAELHDLARPDAPFADWQGPLPDSSRGLGW